MSSHEFDKGKRLGSRRLRYLPDKERYQLTAIAPDKERLIFEGRLDKNRLTLERTDDKKKETQRLVVSLLHFNRYVYRYDVKAADHAFKEVYHVGATKKALNLPEMTTSPNAW